jgi:methyl-accepting chemotaxis protein
LSLSEAVTGALTRIDAAVAEVTRLSQQIGAATQEQAAGATQVAREVSRLAEIAHEIGSATQEQAAGASQVVRLTEGLRETTQQAAAAAAGTTQAAGRLGSSAGALSDIVARFRLPETAAGPPRPAGVARAATPAATGSGRGASR